MTEVLSAQTESFSITSGKLNQQPYNLSTKVIDDLQGFQSGEPFNEVFLELAGQGIGASLNFKAGISKNYSLRLGYGTLLVKGQFFPIGVLYNFADYKTWEIGLSIIPYTDMTDSFLGNSSSVLLSPSIGYRVNIPDNWFVMRVAFTPLYSIEENRGSILFGLTFGSKL